MIRKVVGALKSECQGFDCGKNVLNESHEFGSFVEYLFRAR